MALPTRRIDAGELLQHVSRVVYRGEPLHYGRDGTNRYDAADRSFGVLYLGLALPTALMESVFHKHRWDQDEKRSVALTEVRSRLVRAVGVLEDLQLADLTAPGVMAAHFGLNLEQLASRGYEHTLSGLSSVTAGRISETVDCWRPHFFTREIAPPQRSAASDLRDHADSARANAA